MGDHWNHGRRSKRGRHCRGPSVLATGNIRPDRCQNGSDRPSNLRCVRGSPNNRTERLYSGGQSERKVLRRQDQLLIRTLLPQWYRYHGDLRCIGGLDQEVGAGEAVEAAAECRYEWLGALTLFYCCGESFITSIRRKDGPENFVLAGGLAGILFKSTAGARTSLVAGAL